MAWNEALQERVSPARELRTALGDPEDDDNVFSFARAVECDEQERFPEDAAAVLSEWGLYRCFVPRALGGALPAFDESLAIMRAVSRHDPALAVAFGQCFLAATPAWIAGDAEVQRRTAALLFAGSPMSFALTERAHGSDIVAGDVKAETRVGHHVLHGEKWLINNATRAAALCVLARTEPQGGPRGFSLFLFEKARTPTTTFRHLPKMRTHGIRSADISGIVFEGARVDNASVIGTSGSGVEVALGTLLVTRTMCPGFSLGAADTALRLVLRFARERKLYGSTVWNLRPVREQLASAWSDLLVCDALANAGARALHTVPEQISVWAAASKYFVPTRVEEIFRSLASVLGARFYLREEYVCGIFQKLLRDAMVVGLFDGSTMVNLHALALQLQTLARRSTESDPGRAARGRLVFSRGQALPEADLSRLSLTARGANDAVQLLASTAEALADARLQIDVRRSVGSALAALRETLARDERTALAIAPMAARESSELFELARRYCAIHAAACAAGEWLASGASDGEWLAVALHRLCLLVGCEHPPPGRRVYDAVAEQLAASPAAHRSSSFTMTPEVS